MTRKTRKLPSALGAYEAKTHLPAILRAIRTGRRFTITHRGEAVAELVPATGASTRRDAMGYPSGYFDAIYGSCPELTRPVASKGDRREPIE